MKEGINCCLDDSLEDAMECVPPNIDGTQFEPPSGPALEVEGVTFQYGAVTVLEDVSLKIAQGDFVSFVGPNGGGKTTLVKVILGLLKPVVGKVWILGKSPEENRRHVGYIPQRPLFDPQFPVSVLDVVLMGRLGIGPSLGFYHRQDKEQAITTLSEVGLAKEHHRSFSALSGGQQQRVLIARALVCEPEILLLDEPTSNLDVHMEEAFYELLEKLNQRMTIVLVSHDLGFVSRYVRTVVCVKRNVIVHPTSQITGEIIQDIYGGEMRMVRHDLHH
jgi:zinc transport system ATP-binding protein